MTSQPSLPEQSSSTKSVSRRRPIGKGRLEAFSDAVIAIILTIMVLEMKPPHGHTGNSMKSLWPILPMYAISFTHIGIYWNHHHHLLHATERINGMVMLANLNFLFWLSLTPFTTQWMGESDVAMIPTILYCVLWLIVSLSFIALEQSLVALHGCSSPLGLIVRFDPKKLVSAIIMMTATGVAFVQPYASMGLIAIMTPIWIFPDARLIF